MPAHLRAEVRRIVHESRRDAGEAWLDEALDAVVGALADAAAEGEPTGRAAAAVVDETATACQMPYGEAVDSLHRTARRMRFEGVLDVAGRVRRGSEIAFRLDCRDGRSCTGGPSPVPCRGETVALAAVPLMRRHILPLAAVVDALAGVTAGVTAAVTARDRERADLEERVLHALGGSPRGVR